MTSTTDQKANIWCSNDTTKIRVVFEAMNIWKKFFFYLGQCHIVDGLQTGNCSSDICLGLQLDVSLAYESRCLYKANQHTPFALSIITLVNSIPLVDDPKMMKINSEQSILYTCKGKKCNSLSGFKKLNQTIRQHYNLSKMFQILNNDEEWKKKPNNTVSIVPNTKTSMAYIINSTLRIFAYPEESQSSTTLTFTETNTFHTMTNGLIQFSCSMNIVILSSLILILCMFIT